MLPISWEKSFKIFLGIFLAVLFIANFLVIFGWLTNFFFISLIIIVALTAFSLLVVSFFKKTWPSRSELVVLVCLLVFAALIVGCHHDIPVGRDDMSYIIMSTEITENGSLAWEDFFSRPVHGVRHIEGEQFTSQFLPLYGVYLAFFQFVLGIRGVFIANALLVLLSSLVIFYLIKLLANKKAGVIWVVFWLSSYFTLWFSRRQNSENLIILLFWTSVWMFVLGVKKKSLHSFALGFLASALMIFTRAEGIVLFLMYLIALAIYLVWKRQYFQKKWSGLVLFLPTLFAIPLLKDYIMMYEGKYLLDQFSAFWLMIEILYQPIWHLTALLIGVLIIVWAVLKTKNSKNRSHTIQKIVLGALLVSIILFEALFCWQVYSDNLSWALYRSQFVLEMFGFYFLFLYLLIVLAGLKRAAYNKFDLIPLILAMPVFVLFIEPNIALDQPWFMRRFFPVIIPLLIIMASLALVRLDISAKKLTKVVLGIVLVNLIIASPVIWYRDNNGLLAQLEESTKDYSSDTLLLLEPGWAWQKVALPLHYLYSIDALPNLDLYTYKEFSQDLPGLIREYPNWQASDDYTDLLGLKNYTLKKQQEILRVQLENSQYNNVYVWSTDNSDPHQLYGFDNLESIGALAINYSKLERTANITGYIKSGPEVLDIEKLRKKQRNTPPRNYVDVELDLYIYQVNDPQAFKPPKRVYVAPGEEYLGDHQRISEKDLLTFQKEVADILNDVQPNLNGAE